jgi:uncharacterized small protein (DUF1192 family)
VWWFSSLTEDECRAYCLGAAKIIVFRRNEYFYPGRIKYTLFIVYYYLDVGEHIMAVTGCHKSGTTEPLTGEERTTHMNDTDDTTYEQPGIDHLEQRIAALEDENERIRIQLDQQRESGLSNVTRRQALGGLLGGGALFGAAGTASADPPSGAGGPPFADEDHDHSGDVLGKGEPVESITAHTFHDQPYIQEKNDGIADRDIVSAGPIQIWVDPDGDDNAAGTEDAPVASLQEAINRLPYILAHPVDIVLTSGTPENPTVHDTGNGVISGIHVSVYSSDQEGKRYFDGATSLNVAIRSESGNPKDTVLYGDYFQSFAFLGNSVLNVGFKNLTIEAGVQSYGGVFGCLDCILKGSPELGILFAGYSGVTYATRCTITAPVVTTDSGGAVTGLNNCTVDPGVRTAAVGERAVMASADTETATDNQIEAADAILRQYQSGVTIYIKGGDIKIPYFGEGAIGIIITLENTYHPAAPDGII